MLFDAHKKVILVFIVMGGALFAALATLAAEIVV